MKAILYFDGASKGNPGPAGWGYILHLEDGGEVSGYGSLGTATNNQAEYRGLIEGLKKALELGVEKVIVKGDSQLVVEQMKGNYRVKNPNIRPLYEDAMKTAHVFKKVVFAHIPREKNKIADRLANKGAELPEE